jgi:hypothetical protein
MKTVTVETRLPSFSSEWLRASMQGGENIAQTLVGGGIAIYSGAHPAVFAAVAGGLAAYSYWNMRASDKRLEAAHDREALVRQNNTRLPQP